jgi:hypothetical protein
MVYPETQRSIEGCKRMKAQRQCIDDANIFLPARMVADVS